MENKIAIRALSALAQEHRLAIFRLLVKEGPSGLTAGEIAKAVGISATSLSFHLKELDAASLLRTWREGRYIRSAVHVGGMRQLLTFLTDDCCGGNPEICGEMTGAASDFCLGSAGETND